MLRDCQRIFEEVYKKEGDALLIDEVIPKEGTYLLVKIEEEGIKTEQIVEISFDKKTKECHYSVHGSKRLIRTFDYYSSLLEMNKPIDSSKCIHSNNFLSFAVKKESILNKKLKKETIENYYETLRNPREKYAKKQAGELYDEIEQRLGLPDMELINRIEAWIKDNVFSLDINYEQKNYLKLFFYFENEEDTIKKYRTEYERYVLPNIYNNNAFNQQIGDTMYGLPNDNLGMNGKKPFLANKSRGKIEVPYLLTQQEALMQRKFFDYLMNAAANGKRDIFFDASSDAMKPIMCLSDNELPDGGFSGYYLRIMKGKNEAEIQDFQIISHFSPNLKKPFAYRKYITKRGPKGIVYQKGDTEKFYQVERLQETINEVFFHRYLTGNFFTKVNDLSMTDSVLKRNLIAYRHLIWKWMRSGARPDYKVGNKLDELARKSIMGSLQSGYTGNVVDQFCLKQAMKLYFDGNKQREETMLNIGKELQQKIAKKESWDMENDEVYFYAVGQLVQYFLNKSKAAKKPLSKINLFLKAKDDKKIKELLRKDFKKYNYEIENYYFALRYLYAGVTGYVPKNGILEDYILQGFLDESVLFVGGKN